MTRKKLGKLAGERRTFTGVFERFGEKPAYRRMPLPTLLLRDIVDVANGQRVSDHLWFNLTVGFQCCGLQPGDRVQFDARVKAYWKGYEGRNEMVQLENPVSQDWKLSHPTKISKLLLGELK